jgi:RimJ/RimL family protein N-acetyltransferase
MLSLAFGEFALETVVARIDEPNAASRAMIVRLGFTEDARVEPNADAGETEVLMHYSLRKDAAPS